MGSQQTKPQNISRSESDPKDAMALAGDDEPDDWDKRIFSTGCAAENTKMNDCYFEKKDWRLCKKELITLFDKQLENFRRCWKQQENDRRTETKDA